MNRRTFLQTPAAAASLSAAAAQQPPPGAGNSRPNVIWLFADQHRAQAMGCAGDPNARTPNIDNYAATGIRFSGAVGGYPLCCPFRGSLLSGRYPHKCIPGHEYPMPTGQKTIAHAFNDHNYRTAWFGKWHVDGFKERTGRAAMHIIPPERRGGFETWMAYENNNSQWDSWIHGGQGKDAFHYRLPGYETDELTNLLIKYIRERAQEAKAGAGAKPFFAGLSVQPPHDPYVAPADFMGRYNSAKLELRHNMAQVDDIISTARRDLAGYYAMIENWDWNIGRIREVLNETGLADNTHLMIFADHGDMHGSQGMFRKTNPYEESIRVPFIIAGEKQRYNGRNVGIVPVPINHVDIAPTTLGLCGLPKAAWMEGTDFSHYRLASRPRPANEPDSAYLQSVIPTGHGNSINKPWRGIATKDGWKYACFENHSWLLFNLNEDPYEQANLAHNNRYRAERKKLINRVKQWANDTGDTFPFPED
jgi:arylsulfatase A-like enzyme